jgi:CxxC motif-containing protein (DUF1111 family)
MRLLAAPEPGPLDDEARAGERLFQSMGCAACHTPILVTARSANPVFDRKEVRLYSDLLLHDVGTGDGIKQAAAEPGEIRTPALWGLRHRRPLMHDGASPTVDAAIRLHAGEALAVKEQYSDATPAARAMLLAFLNSL